MPDQAQNLLWERDYTPEGEPNVIQTQGIRLTAVQSSGGAEEPLPPGVYMLEVRDPTAAAQQDGGSSVQRAVIILSNNNITFKRAAQGQSLAWLTDLATGQPVADVPVTFTRTGPEIAQASTDGDGVAMADLGLTAQEQWSPYFAYTGQPGDADFAVVSSDWAEGIEPWLFNLSTGGSYEQILMNLYTERPIYRPGQTVFWKGIVRVLQDDAWTLPPAGQEVIIKINDGMGNLVYTGSYPINENGTVHGEFMLAPDALTGYYSLNADVPRDSESYYSASGYFQVAAYRKPEFQIAVTTDQPEYIQGDTVKVDGAGRLLQRRPAGQCAGRMAHHRLQLHLQLGGRAGRALLQLRSVRPRPARPTTRTTPTRVWSRRGAARPTPTARSSSRCRPTWAAPSPARRGASTSRSQARRTRWSTTPRVSPCTAATTTSA